MTEFRAEPRMGSEMPGLRRLQWRSGGGREELIRAVKVWCSDSKHGVNGPQIPWHNGYPRVPIPIQRYALIGVTGQIRHKFITQVVHAAGPGRPGAFSPGSCSPDATGPIPPAFHPARRNTPVPAHGAGTGDKIDDNRPPAAHLPVGVDQPWQERRGPTPPPPRLSDRCAWHR